MANIKLPSPSITISKLNARRFALAHHHLWPPRQLEGKPGILKYIEHVGCIQFDTINTVGRNPDLVLQSRVAGYRPDLLAALLYEDRQLIDGWDKVASIYLSTDWPFFTRQRIAMHEYYGDPDSPPMKIAPEILKAIRKQGPLSSIDLKMEEKVNWSWGQETRLARASMESLYALGKLGIHHRVGTRRVFDLIERLAPAELLSAPDPNESDEAYQDWHVLRRIGSMGIANPQSGEHWLGIRGVKSPARRASINRLVHQGKLVTVAVDELPGHTFFLRADDMPNLEMVCKTTEPTSQAAFIAPLDNLIWDRKALKWVFEFEYIWEVYKPPAQRKYGYYVLPVLYGDRFVARTDFAFDKKSRELTIRNWWWEEGVQGSDPMKAAIAHCTQDFAKYLNASRIDLGDAVRSDQRLRWAILIYPSSHLE